MLNQSQLSAKMVNKKKVKIYNSSPESIIQDIYEFVDLQKFAEKDLGQVV